MDDSREEEAFALLETFRRADRQIVTDVNKGRERATDIVPLVETLTVTARFPLTVEISLSHRPQTYCSVGLFCGIFGEAVPFTAWRITRRSCSFQR